MKKALLAVAAIALVVWVISWFRNPGVVAASAAKEWPGGLGSLESVAARYPPLKENEAAVRLTALAKGKDVAAIRDLLLREPVVWGRPGGVHGVGAKEVMARRVMVMNLARSLVASGGWDDLHAAWNLARSLDAQPEMMEQTAALSIARMVNAAAWKMPLPVPAWFAEVTRRDPVPRLIEAFQYLVAVDWQGVGRVFPSKWLADSVEIDRRTAESLAREIRCDVRVPVNRLGTDLSTLWQRAFRYRAEREATANALRIREGKPIEARSQCSDGAWSFDGTTLRFSREIPSPPPGEPMPLVLRVKD